MWYEVMKQGSPKRGESLIERQGQNYELRFGAPWLKVNAGSQIPVSAARPFSIVIARQIREDSLDRRKPAVHDKTTQVPLLHPTPAAPEIAVQSMPSPRDAHPPQFSSSSKTLTHSKPDSKDEPIGHAERLSGQKVASSPRAWMSDEYVGMPRL